MPVVLISTINRRGIRNIAPYANVMPILRPWDLIAIASWIKRDTLDNIRETKEFVYVYFSHFANPLTFPMEIWVIYTILRNWDTTP